MNVISIKSTKKLNKDGVYKVAFLRNQNVQNSLYFTPTVRIYLRDNSIQTFPLSSFKPESGVSFPDITWVDSDYQQMLNEREQVKIDKNLKSGDYVVPVHDSLKTLIKGRKYKVTEVVTKDHITQSGVVSWSEIKIKLEGSQRLYIAYNFRKCTSQEVREIGLKELFDEQSETEKVNRFKRKFDYLSDDEKKSTLVEMVMESATDRYRNQKSVLDWAVEKTGSKYSVKIEDFDPILELSLKSILEIIEK